MSPTQIKRYLYDTVIDDFKFEGLGSFRHLGSVLRKGNKARTDTLSTIITAHRAHSAFNTLPSCKLLSRNTKLNFYKTL